MSVWKKGKGQERSLKYLVPFGYLLLQNTGKRRYLFILDFC